MKQKVVIKVPMHCQKCRSKALKIVAGFSGVISAALIGDDKSQIEVIGDGVDAVKLATLLRKKMRHAELVTVSPAGGDGEKKEENKEKVIETSMQPLVWTHQCGVPQYYVTADRFHDPYSCSIM